MAIIEAGWTDRQILEANPCPECGQIEIREREDGSLYAVCPCALEGGVDWDADTIRAKVQRSTRLSKAAAVLGRKGGKAGRGASKRRPVTSEQMRTVRAARPKPQVYESRGEWGGYTVREGLKGWVVDVWSAVTGTRSGERWLLPYTPCLPRTMRLGESANDYGTLNAEIVVEERTRGRCLRRGHTVR